MRKILLFVSALVFSAMMTTNAGEAFVYNGLHYETMTDVHGNAACKVMKSDDYLTMTEVVIPDSAYYEAGGKCCTSTVWKTIVSRIVQRFKK